MRTRTLAIATLAGALTLAPTAALADEPAPDAEILDTEVSQHEEVDAADNETERGDAADEGAERDAAESSDLGWFEVTIQAVIDALSDPTEPVDPVDPVEPEPEPEPEPVEPEQPVDPVDPVVPDPVTPAPVDPPSQSGPTNPGISGGTGGEPAAVAPVYWTGDEVPVAETSQPVLANTGGPASLALPAAAGLLAAGGGAIFARRALRAGLKSVLRRGRGTERDGE